MEGSYIDPVAQELFQARILQKAVRDNVSLPRLAAPSNIHSAQAENKHRD
jgi:hypothetical protein